jgi:hypothetical protein
MIVVAQLVIVRDFEGEPLVRRVCGVNTKKVFVCIDQKKSRSPIGFPREDVFEYNPVAIKDIQANYKSNPMIWKHVKQWSKNLHG